MLKHWSLPTVVMVCCLNFVGIAFAQTLSGETDKGSEELTAEGRLLVGRAPDYVPSTESDEQLAHRLASSMKERRDFAWGIVDQLLKPTKVKLAKGDVVVDVPVWQTWYEGASDNNELGPITELFFRKLKARPQSNLDDLAKETLNDFGKKELAKTLTDAQFESQLLQFKNVPGIPAEFGGRGFTLFSPSFVEHMLSQSRGVEQCERTAKATDVPADPKNFSNCIKEFPRSAVMIKAVWGELEDGVSVNDTSANAMKSVIANGTWPGVSPATTQVPDESQIYTNISKQKKKYGLQAIHFSTKDVREWVWLSLWWDPNARVDFGADMPESIKNYNGGVWQNYKMCVTTSFNEEDSQPWSHYSGATQSLGDSIKATYDAIRDQIATGATQVPEFSNFDAKSLGPWSAPHDKMTTWCSNPKVEIHPANGRTSCIGCHQASFSMNDERNATMEFWQVMAGDVPQLGRSQYRQNFPADFAWSFGFEFQDLLKTSRESAGFQWP